MVNNFTGTGDKNPAKQVASKTATTKITIETETQKNKPKKPGAAQVAPMEQKSPRLSPTGTESDEFEVPDVQQKKQTSNKADDKTKSTDDKTKVDSNKNGDETNKVSTNCVSRSISRNVKYTPDLMNQT